MFPVSPLAMQYRKRLWATSRQQLRVLSLCGAIAVGSPHKCQATTYLLPLIGRESVVGEIQSTQANQDDTLVDIGRRYDLGYDQIVRTNSTVNRWVPGAGTRVSLPSQYILPNTRYEGIVLNLAELRLYYFPPIPSDNRSETRPVMTFPVSIGRMDWTTPLGTTHIASKERDPAWYPPKSIKEEHAAEGEELPEMIPGGRADNPLGHFALRLKIPGYLIHGTDEQKAFGIGMRVTHGCVRMYPEDIAKLFQLVDVGTPVTIIDQPVKVGWKGSHLYLEAHTPFEEESDSSTVISETDALTAANQMIQSISTQVTELDQAAVRRAVEVGDGIPVVIGETINLLPPARH